MGSCMVMTGDDVEARCPQLVLPATFSLAYLIIMVLHPVRTAVSSPATRPQAPQCNVAIRTMTLVNLRITTMLDGSDHHARV